MKTNKERIEIKYSQRVFIAGKTGCGKTTLAEKLLQNVGRLVVIDPKVVLKDKFNLSDDVEKGFKLLEQGKNARIRIVSPVVQNQELLYEDYFRRIYDIGNIILYIDELQAISKNAREMGMFLKALYTRGRELNIGVWASTQRPSFIPLFAMSESDYFFIFKLQLLNDRKRIAEIVGDEAKNPVKNDHGFYVFSVEKDKLEYCAGLNI